MYLNMQICPFCGIPPVEGYVKNTGDYVYLCVSCYLRSNFEQTQLNALRDWNKKCKEYAEQITEEENTSEKEQKKEKQKK